MGRIKIIGGMWRGRYAPVLNRQNVRPTPQRLRETVFNWLNWQLEGTHCLDLFAGSGSLGFEAASRGAGAVLLLEKSDPVYQQLKKTQRVLQARSVRIQKRDAFSYCRHCALSTWQIIFVDPPFYRDLVSPTLYWLYRRAARDVVVYVEQEAAQAYPFLQHWCLLKTVRCGQSAGFLLTRAAYADPG